MSVPPRSGGSTIKRNRYQSAAPAIPSEPSGAARAALRSPSASGRFSTLRSRGYMIVRTMCCPARKWRQRSRMGEKATQVVGPAIRRRSAELRVRSVCEDS
jgi:hypothetical protein